MSAIEQVVLETFKLLRTRRFEQFQFLVAILGALIAVGASYYEKHQKETLRQQNLTYEKQLAELTQVQSSIDNLRDFVGTQKLQLQEQQAVLQDLKLEKEKLQPVVEADKQVVEALFRIQSERNRSSIWFERLIGFLIGIVSSLVASLVWSVFRSRRSNKVLQPTDSPPASRG